MRQKALEAAQTDRRGFILGLDTLRSESSADIFATSLLFESTFEILRTLAAESTSPEEVPRFEIGAFIAEMIIALNVIAFLDRCRRVAIQACTAAPRQEHLFEAVLHPAAVAIRIHMVRYYLEFAVPCFLFGEDPAPEERTRVSEEIDGIIESLRPAVEAMEQGLSRAIRFALDRDQRANFFDSLRHRRNGLLKDPTSAAIQRIDVEGFCRLALLLALLARTGKQLRNTIALRLPLGLDLRIVIEGENDFAGHMQELEQGTIWPE